MGHIEPDLATILQEIPSGIIIVDRQEQVIFINQAAEKLTGWGRSEAVGQPFSRVLPVADDSGNGLNQVLLTYVLESGRSFRPQVPAHLADSNQADRYLEIQAAPLRDAQRGVSGTIFIFQDVTDQARQEKERENYIAELEAFSHTVAHNLQHALSPIIGYAEVLETAHASLSAEELSLHLRAISRNGHRMRNIIDELLLLAGVKKRQVQMMALDMGTIITNVQRRLSYMIEEAQAEIILPESWPVAWGYSPWVEEIWVNYISNGLKYGGHPPRLQLGGEVKSDRLACFWVQDNGRGLKPEEQAQLFTQFTQLGQVRAEGHGLGLSIVERIVKRLGGEVGVESEGIAGRGSRFSFTLPLVGEEMTSLDPTTDS